MLYPNKQTPICELQLGDVVSLFDGPWGTAIVTQIHDGQVTFFRPYGHASLSCVYAGNKVICYNGTEEFTRPATDKATVLLYQRPEEDDFEISFKLQRKVAELEARPHFAGRVSQL